MIFVKYLFLEVLHSYEIYNMQGRNALKGFSYINDKVTTNIW